MLSALEELVDPGHVAVIVIDVQNDFCHPEGALAKRGRDVSFVEAMVPKLLTLIEQARKAGVPVLFVKTVHNDWTCSPAWLRQAAEKRSVCEEGSWGADFYKVAPLEGEPVIIKHRYSAFVNTDLDLILRSKGVKTLIVTGTTTNVCAESTARDGYMRDYFIVFLKDCCAAYTLAEHEATLANIDRYFGTVATSGDIVQIWKVTARV